MKQVTQHNRSGAIKVIPVPRPAVRPGFVLVRTACSVISAGTERASVTSRKSSLLDRARKNPDLVLKVLEQVRQYGLAATYRRVRGRLDASSAMGYSVAGTVVAIGAGVSHVRPDDRVACAGAGYASHAEYVLVPENLCCRMPKGVTFAEAAYTTIGSIALQGVRQTEPTLGETVVVIGLGLIGQITVQLLKANGCVVVGVDLDAEAVKLALRSGADAAVHRTRDDVKSVVHHWTGGRGADAVIITAATPSDDPVRLAGDLCRDKGRVVLVGDVGLHLPRGPYYMKELDFRLSRSYGPGRYDPSYEEQGRDYPAGYVRWTENRNMGEFLRLLGKKALDLSLLTTHRFVIDEAERAYALVAGQKGGRKERFVGVLLEYPETSDRSDDAVVRISGGETPRTNALSIGFIGAGSFAQASLLPTIQSAPGVTLLSVCTGNGLNASNVAMSFGFRSATADPERIIEDPKVGTVFIATRHNLHAPITIAALNAGKHVFVEKPLAMNDAELAEVVRAHRLAAGRTGASVMVGFNRRFAPLVQGMKEFFGTAAGPFVMNYRVNAGVLPSTHWTRDRVEGGGRILGEVCHFVDLMQYVAGAAPVEVFASALGKAADDDSVVANVRFANGSVGTITYAANGDRAVPKEYFEAFSTGRTAILDNFQRLTLFRQGKMEEHRRSTIDKGHHEEVRRFLEAVGHGTAYPIPFDEAVAATRATFRMAESLTVGMPVKL